MIADVPLGAFLSGGVDSSIVVAEMAAASSGPIKTFSIGFENEDYNELPRAREVAERFGTDHQSSWSSPTRWRCSRRSSPTTASPTRTPRRLPTFYLAEKTREHVTVALNGDGGDESFAGYPRHLANARTAWLDRVPLPVAAVAPRPAPRAIPRPPTARAVATTCAGCWSRSRAPVPSATGEHVSIFDDAGGRRDLE